MQCWNCEFENIPGLQACARCGSPLSLDAVIVEPQRASRLHVMTRTARFAHRVRPLVPNIRPLLVRLRFLLPEPLSWRALAWSFIPGLGHLKTNRRRLGLPILVIWLVLLALAVFSIGTTWTWLCLSGMVVTHTVAILSLFAANLAYERLLMRAVFGTLLFMCLNYLVYGPVQWLCGQLDDVVVIAQDVDGDVMVKGDGFLVAGPCVRPEFFRRGELVVCRVHELSYRAFIVRPGYNIDRVVAVPGDHVQMKAGILLVNREPPPEGQGPLSSVPPGELELTLGHDEYMVLPSFLDRQAVIEAMLLTLPAPDRRPRELPGLVLRHLTVFRYDDVLGRVLLRLRPLSRFGTVD